jgi:hypothetical protein
VGRRPAWCCGQSRESRQRAWASPSDLDEWHVEEEGGGGSGDELRWHDHRAQEGGELYPFCGSSDRKGLQWRAQTVVGGELLCPARFVA